MDKGKIIIIGPGHPLRGGLATFNQRLAKEFTSEGYDVSIYSFSLQYPSFLFPGKTQFSTEPAPEGVTIHAAINSINPFNWIGVGRKLKKLSPDIIVVRYWLPFMGPALGSILRKVRQNKHTKIIAITDNILPHEKRPGDIAFTKYFLNSCDAYITMSDQVMRDLRRFQKTKPARLVLHPLYDNFGEPVPKEEARKKLELPREARIILFFGFIRKYKGLDLLLEAMADPRIKNGGIRLLIAGEFYEDEKPYQELIKKFGIQEQLILRTGFIPESEVKYFLCAADVVVQPYRMATQSGVTPLAYHFEKPMIVSNVGGLPSMVPHEIAGLVTPADPLSLASAIIRYYELGEHYFIPHLRSEKKNYSWINLVKTITGLAHDLQK